MGSNTGVRHERQEVSSTDSPRVEGLVRGNFFAVFFLLYCNSGLPDRMIYIRKNSIEFSEFRESDSLVKHDFESSYWLGSSPR